MAPFCSCPASLVSRKFFAVGPGCAKCFFCCCAPLGAAPFRRGQSKKKKKKHHPGCFFLLWPRAGGQRGFSFPCLSPGPEQKKNTWVVFFFFALAPCRRPTGLLLPLPFAVAAAKKNTLGWCFFFCSGPVPARGFSFPCLSPGPEQKKKHQHPGWCVFFCCGPARTLTHSLRAWVAMPPPRRSGVFSFAAAPPGPGWCFFFLLWPRPDAHSLTVGWGDFGKARVVFCFFAAAPPGLFRQ